MKENPSKVQQVNWPKLGSLPTPAKALFTAIILVMAIAMIGASGQIIVHDIIPTFFSAEGYEGHAENQGKEPESATEERGDLLGIQVSEEKHSLPFYKTEQFVWTLKWTHIHLFGMSMIFIFMGIVTLFLDLSSRVRTWLIVLPFAGVQVDIATMWIKGYVSQAFFWLHILGGGIFGAVFVIVAVRALYEMWGSSA